METTSNKERIIAIWQECEIEIADVANDESQPTTGYESIGKIKEKSTTLETSDGESLELKASGGHTVDMVETEGGFAIKTTVIEPTKLYKALGLTEDDYTETGKMKVKTHVVADRKAVRLSPKRVGAMGVQAPVTHVAFKPTGSEEEGGSAEVTFDFLFGQQEYWYERFKKTATASVEGA